VWGVLVRSCSDVLSSRAFHSSGWTLFLYSVRARSWKVRIKTMRAGSHKGDCYNSPPRGASAFRKERATASGNHPRSGRQAEKALIQLPQSKCWQRFPPSSRRFLVSYATANAPRPLRGGSAPGPATSPARPVVPWLLPHRLFEVGLDGNAGVQNDHPRRSRSSRLKAVESEKAPYFL